MKLSIAIDPGKSGGYAIAWGSLTKIHLHNLGEDFEFVEHMQDLKDHPDVDRIEAFVELVPPFAGKMIPSSTSFKLGKSCGFLEGALRALEIPYTLVRTGLAERAGWPKWADIGQKEEGSYEPCQATLPNLKGANAENSGCLTDSSRFY